MLARNICTAIEVYVRLESGQDRVKERVVMTVV